MTFKKFPLYRSHLDLTRIYWERYLSTGLKVIDATCGNGLDSLYISKKILSNDQGNLFCIDIQEKAIQNTRHLLETNLSPCQFKRISFHQESFELFPPNSHQSDMIVYNLGYLPGGDKTITTTFEKTLKSLSLALDWLSDGGLISLSCYPGHSRGLLEFEKIHQYLKELNPQKYTICCHDFLNRTKAPLLILIQKALAE